MNEISRSELSDFTNDKFGENCHKFIAKLPLVPLKFKTVIGYRVPVYDVNELIESLELYTNPDEYDNTTYSYEVRLSILNHLKGKICPKN